MKNSAQEKLDALALNYTQNLPVKLAVINKQWQELLLNFQHQGLVDFHRVVHTLCGSAGTYGFVILSQAARNLEEFLRELLGAQNLSADQINIISHLLNTLNETPLSPQHEISCPDNIGKSAVNNKLIFLMDVDEILYYELDPELAEIGYKLKLMRNFSEFALAAKSRIPAAIIVSSKNLRDVDSDVLVKLCKEHHLPLICISKKDDLETRLLSLRAGAAYFLVKPVNISYLTKLLDRLCENLADEVYRILILDDSLALAQYYVLVLQEAGMEAMAITDPRQLLIALNDFRPNLLLLDLYMPFCSGLELATILRQEEHFASLPIIFISTENDKLKQLAAIGRGGDDFITKPISPQHLVSTVKSRVKRAVMLMPYIKHDGLTKLLNHTYILEQLGLEVSLASRSSKTVSFAMMDLDYFKKVNDKYGHQVGDAVLVRVSEFLSTRLRKTDFVGRFGGEEFAIILPDTSLEDARQLFDTLRSNFAALKFSGNGSEFNVSFSVGVAEYPGFKTVDELVAAADKALYKAKAEGRNRVVAL